MENSKKKNLTKVLFCIYFFILVWILLFKMSFSLDELYGHRNINLIPYYGSAYVNGRLYMTEIINNILVFVPVGIYVSMIKEDWSILKKISVSFFIILTVEIAQFILAVGATDITDLIGNTMGGIIGVGIFHLFNMIFKNKTINILNILASFSTVGLVSLMGMILIYN